MKRDVILEMQHKNAARLPFFDRISEGLPPGFEKKMSTKDREEKEMITESFKFGFEDSLEAIRGVISILPTEYAEDYQNRNILSDYAREDYFDDPYLCPKVVWVTQVSCFTPHRNVAAFDPSTNDIRCHMKPINNFTLKE